MSSSAPRLVLHLIIYAEESLRPHEAHVALSVELFGAKEFYMFHAVEDTATESEMKFEMKKTDRNPLGTKTTHQSIALQTVIPVTRFSDVKANLAGTPVPQPRPQNWNCQTWMRQALLNLEKAHFLPTETALQYYNQMMQIINTNAKDTISG
jgi:hypothetical protein